MAGNAVIVGSEGNALITGPGGQDYSCAIRGFDRICGGPDETIDAGEGRLVTVNGMPDNGEITSRAGIAPLNGDGGNAKLQG